MSRVESDARAFRPKEEEVFVFPAVETVMANQNVEDTTVTEESEIKTQKLPATKSFAERKHFPNLDRFEYSRKGSDPGRVLIFSHEFFDDKKTLPWRIGTKRDVNEIVICMQRLGFNITKDDVFCDLTATQVMSELEKVKEDKNRLAKCNCFILFFLTHGYTGEELFAKDMSMKTSEIWSKFADCAELKNKPKMFIYQACKGIAHATVPKEQPNEPKNVSPAKILDLSSFAVNPLAKDMLLVYATLEGNESYRSPLTGTWFIQELCKTFSAYGRRDDVLSMLIRTTKCVCKNYYTYEVETPTDFEKQMPVFVSTLRKKFYLNRNKERDMMVNLEKKMDELNQKANEILKILKKE